MKTMKEITRLQSASTELKNDRDIVLKAIENKGRALEGACRKF